MNNLEISKENFPQIYKHYNKDVLNVIKFKVGDLNMSEDLCSEVFMKVYNRIETFDGTKAQFNTWLFTVANNHVIDYFRKENRRKKQTVLTSDFVNENGTEKNSFQIEGSDNADKFEGEELKNRIYKALRTMRPIYRKIAIMYFLNGEKMEKIAENLDIPINTVKGNIFRIREILQVELKQEYAAL